eukprot:gene6260-7507_t
MPDLGEVQRVLDDLYEQKCPWPTAQSPVLQAVAASRAVAACDTVFGSGVWNAADGSCAVVNDCGLQVITLCYLPDGDSRWIPPMCIATVDHVHQILII